MSYKKNWDIQQILSQLDAAGRACNDPGETGFVTWSIKQDLYRIQWRLQEILEKCPRFEPEEEFLEQREKQLVWGTLKKL